MKIIKESSVAKWQDDIMKKVYDTLHNDRIGGDVYDDYDFRSDDSFVMCVEIEWGDWKHEHGRANYVINNLLNDLGTEYSSQYMGEEVTEEDGSDTYSSIHKWFITKDSVTESKGHNKNYTMNESTSWQDHLPNDVFDRLSSCRSLKRDILPMAVAYWNYKLKNKSGYEPEDALIAILEWVDCNGQDIDFTIDEYKDLLNSLNSMCSKSDSIKESVYTDNGFANRREYLQSLADDYGVSLSDVQALASVLGPEEDFDALVTEVEDLAYSQENEEDDYLSFEEELKYKLKNYSYVVVDPDSNEYNWEIIGYTNYEEAADEVILYLLNYESPVELYTVWNHTKEYYDPTRLDVSKLSVGDSSLSFIEDDIDRYVDIYTVGKRAAEENIRDILDMCKVSREKY